ncbi:MAG: hypothetical protein V3V00_05380 [Saprospiraceae bacterium]
MANIQNDRFNWISFSVDEWLKWCWIPLIFLMKRSAGLLNDNNIFGHNLICRCRKEIGRHFAEYRTSIGL